MVPKWSQILRWLMQPQVWRFVSLASAVAGLVSYALSSSFNHMFGDWNFLKIFLYSIFSFIISLTILFAKVWRRSNSLRFKTHLAFLVLTITSACSFFFDKGVNGKPDAYSLVSCAAFAIMSLSLSRQIHCGFEVDLLYFFLGSLIVQLMKIKLFLGIVGVGFGYFLIILRSSLDDPTQTRYAGIQDHIAIQVDSQQTDDDSAIQADSNSQEANTDSALLTMPQLMVLKKKNWNLFRMLSKHVNVYLKANFDSKDEEHIPFMKLVTDHNLVINALPSKIIGDLHETVKLMASAGLEKECCIAYSICRREFLEECLWKLGLQKLGIDKDVTNRLCIQFRIRRWIKASNIALRILFPNERRLCNHVFFGFSSSLDLSFMEICKDFTIQLLNFAETFTTRNHSPNLLCSTLKVFETLSDLIPEFNSLFFDQYSMSLRNDAITIWRRLGQAIRGIFMELENMIRHDPKPAVPGGGLHAVTRYVMTHVCVACRSRQTLEQVFENYGHRLKECTKLDDRIVPTSSLSLQMNRIIELLESSLESKSKIYKDPALSYVFLMNNERYIVQKAKDTELGALLGDAWIQKHVAKIQQYRVHYQRRSWNKVLRLLKLDSNDSAAHNGAVVKSMKEKLKSFNMKFEEICRVQSSWFFFDKKLREEIIISLEQILLPAYRNYIVRLQSVPQLAEHAGIKYKVEDIEARLNNLFAKR